MRKIILTFLAIFMAFILSAQTGKGWVPVEKNQNFKGTLYIAKTVLFPGGVTLSGTNIVQFKEAYAIVKDTIELDSLVYLKAEVYTQTQTNNLLNLKANIASPTFTGGIMGFAANATYPGTLFIGNGGANISHTSGDQGYYNTYLGVGSGQINSTGYNNTGVGYEALRYNGAGASNSAVGFNALRGNLTSNNNTAVGYNSGGALESGNGYNCFFGSSAGSYNVSGEENTAVGSYAGRGGTTVSGNTAIGAYALFTGGGSKNVAIGYKAGYYETGSNKLFIDNLQRSSEADARIKALLYGVFAASPVNQLLTLNGVFKLTPMADPPGTPSEGMIYMDTDHHAYVYNGTTWVQLDN